LGLAREPERAEQGVPVCGVLQRAPGKPEQARAKARVQPSTFAAAAADSPGVRRG